jgi:hypothetical protein
MGNSMILQPLLIISLIVKIYVPNRANRSDVFLIINKKRWKTSV